MNIINYVDDQHPTILDRLPKEMKELVNPSLPKYKYGPHGKQMLTQEDSFDNFASDDPKIYFYERENAYMEKTLMYESYVLKKKANYLEKAFCSAIIQDNVYKLYNWHESRVEKGRRLMRYQQASPSCIKYLCFS
jgi:hypothetical protein